VQQRTVQSNRKFYSAYSTPSLIGTHCVRMQVGIKRAAKYYNRSAESELETGEKSVINEKGRIAMFVYKVNAVLCTTKPSCAVCVNVLSFFGYPGLSGLAL
jgi:hypothetical protein